jgi:PAS domain S-box-containing protein
MKEEDYKNIVENANDAIVVIDDQGKIIYVNQYIADALGHEKEYFFDKNFLDFVTDSHKKNVEDGYRKTMAGQKNFVYEADFLKKNGTFLSGEIRAQKIKYADKEASLVFIRDISTRKKTERVFHLQEERFHGVTENTPDIIARYDQEYRYVYINNTGEEIFGIPKKNFFWKTDKDLGINNEKFEAFKKAIDFVFEKKEKKSFYSEYLINGEKKYYYTILVPEFFKDGEINSVLSITRDITEIREIDQIKTEFISVTSHQLRSPLSIINWCILSLLRENEDVSQEERREYLERIQDSTRKLIKITDTFLNTTMIDLEMFVFNFRKVDPIIALREVLREFEDDIKKKNINLKEFYGNFSLVKLDLLF